MIFQAIVSSATGSVETMTELSGQAQRGLRAGPPWHCATSPSMMVSLSFVSYDGRCSQVSNVRIAAAVVIFVWVVNDAVPVLEACGNAR